MQRFSLYGVHKRDYQESVTIGQTDARTHRQTPDKVIPMCRYASQATQKLCYSEFIFFIRRLLLISYFMATQGIVKLLSRGSGEDLGNCCKRLKAEDYKNLPRLCTGTGKSTRVSKICSPRRGLPSRGCCKSLTRGWISLSLYKVVVDYFSPTAFNPQTKPPTWLSKTTSKRFLVRKRRQLGLIMTSRHCMIYDVTRCSLKRSCLYRGR